MRELDQLCSTPCGINVGITHDYRRGAGHPSIVLNALRHQRRNHSAGACVSLIATVVLNALRHQRRNHSSPRQDEQ